MGAAVVAVVVAAAVAATAAAAAAAATAAWQHEGQVGLWNVFPLLRRGCSF